LKQKKDAAKKFLKPTKTGGKLLQDDVEVDEDEEVEYEEHYVENGSDDDYLNNIYQLSNPIHKSTVDVSIDAITIAMEVDWRLSILQFSGLCSKIS